MSAWLAQPALLLILALVSGLWTLAQDLLRGLPGVEFGGVHILKRTLNMFFV